MSAPRNVVVVGGSIAAVTAVDTLRAEGFQGRVTVLSEEGDPPYTRVPLSKGVLAGRQPPGDTDLGGLPSGVELRLGVRATGLDAGARVVRTTEGDVPFDGLVIASGARARRLGVPGHPRARELVLRSRADGLALSDRLAHASSVLVVGGGFLGMEIASTCCALGKQVTVVDIAPPLDALVGPYMGAVVRELAEQAGVVLAVADKVTLLAGSDTDPYPCAVSTGDGRRFEADVVVTAAGDVPNIEWLAGSGLRVDRGVHVDERCRAAPGIVAAGDVAVLDPPGSDSAWRRIPTWTNAVEQARVAALALLHGDDAPVHRPSRYGWTEQFGWDLKMVGAAAPTGEPAVLDGDLTAGQAVLAWPDADVRHTVMAVNHPTPPARLKRLLRGAV
ncbi:NAD(P)/FAD-dependent oxidoreductase [Streptomyces phaeolivaceus]|uniref:NAD(P)/FAD-dependent oxidoreductase n=1 Tax=Streptomyces phaeolivaceus TaxID=2653200 RepID=A0A5P8KF94_9ACTN|nr:FAD/NAD(P)-binding oxidoreductase [Streptomyces phaeolivaceus]QFR01687.1 NAD(P)/FAD-dependent oxidoreductase [Streptomyces phaeolivaceus]